SYRSQRSRCCGSADRRNYHVHRRRSGLVFFFQAEDGIRDLYVTGVQTCALPISPRTCPRMSRSPRVESVPKRSPPRTFCTIVERSEERRVGKECRFRWSEGEYKKKEEASGKRRESNVVDDLREVR